MIENSRPLTRAGQNMGDCHAELFFTGISDTHRSTHPRRLCHSKPGGVRGNFASDSIGIGDVAIRKGVCCLGRILPRQRRENRIPSRRRRTSDRPCTAQAHDPIGSVVAHWRWLLRQFSGRRLLWSRNKDRVELLEGPQEGYGESDGITNPRGHGNVLIGFGKGRRIILWCVAPFTFS